MGGSNFVSPAAPPKFFSFCLHFYVAVGIVWSELFFPKIADRLLLFFSNMSHNVKMH